ncbi:MAG TPA: phosphoglycerate mutase family protein [Thermoanaerobaculia bacterium]|jgi:phosphohistidine phosphatase|nr:phosphoglycerate mutase family protein [Thermoanaerobaculia bacterium]
MIDNEKFIVLLRHGIAEPHGARADDDARILTETGNRRMKQIGRGLEKCFPKAEVIYSSPLIRCVETAEWVEKAYGSSVTFKTSGALRPDGTIDEFRALIDGGAERRIICVGHEPNLSKTMLGVTKMHSDGAIELKKGGCYGIRMFGDGSAQLEWMLPPRLLRRK